MISANGWIENLDAPNILGVNHHEIHDHKDYIHLKKKRIKGRGRACWTELQKGELQKHCLVIVSDLS
jgi:hypothetical protein